MKRFSFLFFFMVLFSCAANSGTKSDGTDLLGKWRAVKGANPLGQLEYFDLELRADGKGFFGAGLKVGEEERYLPFLSFSISKWTLRGDTLEIEGEVDPAQAMGGDEIRRELSGIQISKTFIVKQRNAQNFKANPVENNSNVIRIASEPVKLEELTFEKR